MRQIATLPNESDAVRFSAFLITQGVPAHAEEEGSIWAIWVRDEDHVVKARDEFEKFQQNPNDASYQGAEKAAEEIERDRRATREAASKNVVEIRGKWSRGGAGVSQPVPFTKTLIFLSITITILGSIELMGTRPSSIAVTVHRQLGFCDRVGFDEVRRDPFVNIKQGQIWRLVTPIFIHADPLGGGFGILHIVFNMFMTYRFAARIEALRGATRLAAYCLFIAVVSNMLQAGLPTEMGGNPFFGGMSGVVFGLFGYVWMKSWYDFSSGFYIDQRTVLFMVIMLFACMFMPQVANVAHVGGLLAGMALGYVPIMIKTIGGN